MNILIISTEYAKRSGIGSVRPLELSKYFISKNHNVTVILPGDYSGELDGELYNKLLGNIRIINVGCPAPEFKDKNAPLTPYTQSKLKKLIFKLLPEFFIKYVFEEKKKINDTLWIKRTKKFIDDALDIKSFDVVFSTAPSERASAIGYYVKKKYGIKWVCDFRDLMVQGHNSPALNRKLKKRQDKYVKAADAVTLVSRGTMEQLKEYKDKIHFIPNGYDGDIGERNLKVSDKLTFTYTGVLYNGERDLSLLFNVLQRLIKDNELSKENIVFNYAGNEGKVLFEQAEKYDLCDIIKDYGYISQKEAKNLQKNSDFLVIASWNTKENIGVIPAKIYEYMIAAKPVISVVSGDVPNAELSYMVEDMHLGCDCEYIDYNNSVNKLCNYLKEQIKSTRDTGEYIYNPDYEKMKFYKRETTAENMIKLFEKLVKEE